MKFNFGLKTKRFLSNTVFKVLSIINKIIRHNPNKVLFYSNVEFRDNNLSLFKYMIDNHYDDKYQIICYSSDYKLISNYFNLSNVRFVNLVKCIFTFFTAGKVFYTFGHLPIEAGKEQEILQIWHGTPLKDVDQGSLLTHPIGHRYYTKVLSTSKHFIPMVTRFFNVPKSSVVVCGMPRNEELFEPSPQYELGNYTKLIIWMPTFRKSWRGFAETDNPSQSSIPIINTSDFVQFNSFLQTINVKIIIKLHPAQDLKQYRQLGFDNLVILSHNDFVGKGFDMYRLLVQSDALITDYSSVFFDYLLLDKPIGFTIDDMKSYGNKRGFVMDNPLNYMPGFKISSLDDLKTFCNNLASGKDDFKSERSRVNSLVNDFKDGLFCKRILEIMEIYN